MKIKFYFFVILLCQCMLNGQVGFESHSVVDRLLSVHQPEFIHSADLDNDGDLDIISVSIGENKLAWYENLDGLGNFGTQQIISTILTYGKSAHTADLDNDGDLDIVACGDDKILWFENMDGQGDFGTEQVISNAVNRASSVLARDIDNDGDFDVISASSWDHKLAWYENTDGQGNFGDQQIISSNEGKAEKVHAADIDNDGDLDILVASASSSKINWYENIDGLGSFNNGQEVASNFNGVESIYTSDFDGDGDEDIIAASWNNSTDQGEVIWYENTDGLGNFQSQQVLNSTVNGFDDVFAVDLDGDGDIDILSASRVDDEVAWYENLDNLGTFGPEQVITSTAEYTRSISASDIDGDGDFDVIAASATADKLTWYDNEDGQGNFSSEKIITLNPVQRPYDVHISDLDGDGYKDIISASNDDNKIAWYKYLPGESVFGDQNIITQEAYGAYDVVNADVDGDGDNDVISVSWDVTNLYGDRLAWYENLDGAGNFGGQNLIPIEDGGPVAVIATDLDGDDDLDIVTGIFSGDKISWFENLDGMGTYGVQTDISTGLDGVADVHAADMDNDGDQDILGVSIGNDLVVLYENLDGLGTFSAELIIATDLDKGSSILGCDIDDDGDMDILASSFADDKIVWYENSGGLNFGTEQIVGISTDVIEEAYPSDIDNDGDLDVVGALYGEEKLVWYENLDGLGDFGTEQIIEINLGNINSLKVADIDLDGDVDIATTSSDLDHVMWFENLGITSNKIQGHLLLDIDGTGCDDTDLPIDKVMVVSSSSTEDLATFSLTNGVYQLFPSLGDYTTSITSAFPAFYDVDPLSELSTFSAIGFVDTVDFCISPNQTINDLNIAIFPTSEARPGFDATYQLVCRNVGTTQISGDILLEFNGGMLQFLTSSETVSAQTASSLTFDYMDLNPFESRTIDLQFNVLPPPTVNIDDVLSFTSTINPVSGDVTADDNTFDFDQTVIGSYDPNDIRVLEGEEILIEDVDKYLHYIIRFQNTGTADAINVRVHNILDDHLDWNTFQLESFSHSNRVEIMNGNEVDFIFNGIYLPDSTTNEPESHGFIAYKIKPKSGTQVGDIISNQADIFFDFNEAIVTNMVTTEVVESVSVKEKVVNHFSIYPIPTNGILFIKSEIPIAQIEIYDRLGQLLLANTDKNEINISTLPQGVYICKIKDGNGSTESKKIIKE